MLPADARRVATGASKVLSQLAANRGGMDGAGGRAGGRKRAALGRRGQTSSLG